MEIPTRNRGCLEVINRVGEHEVMTRSHIDIPDWVRSSKPGSKLSERHSVGSQADLSSSDVRDHRVNVFEGRLRKAHDALTLPLVILGVILVAGPSHRRACLDPTGNDDRSQVSGRPLVSNVLSQVHEKRREIVSPCQDLSNVKRHRLDLS
jgi:hypothetical protein